MFNALKKNSRTDQIVQEIKSAVLEGKLKTGDRLPPERELAGQFGVSRTSIREAVKILAAYGLIKSVQGDGLYVADQFTENMFEFLGYGSFLTAENCRDLFQARLVIETGSLMAALEDVTDEDIVKLEACVAETLTEDDPTRLQAIDAEFHITLVQASRNPILTGMYGMLHKIMRNGSALGLSVYPAAKQKVLRDHRRIIRAVRSKSRNRVYHAVAKHLDDSLVLFDEVFRLEARAREQG